MSPSLAKTCAWLSVWGLVLTGTLSIANWPGDWGHSVCGAWGCGPPLQALVACHVAWLVVLIPTVIIARRFVATKTLRRAAASVLFLTVTGLLAIVVNQSLTWLAQVSEWQRQFYWQRVGFVILTAVELPILELAGLSTLILLWSIGSRHPGRTLGNHYLGVTTVPDDAGATAGTESSNSMMAEGREYPESV
jgi:hypothetical protein